MSSQYTMLETFADTLKLIGKKAAEVYAPELTSTFTRIADTAKQIKRSFNQPKAAVEDMFKENPDTFRDCKIIDIKKNAAAGVPAASTTTGPALSSSYLNSYKVIFKGSVKQGNEANSPLVQSNNFSITVKPTGSDRNNLKYIADEQVFKDDVAFSTIKHTSIDDDYTDLFKIPTLNTKFKLDRSPNFNPLGYVTKGKPNDGKKLNFDGMVTFPPSPPRPVKNDEYIIVTTRSGTPTSDGKLYTTDSSGNRILINAGVIVNYSQKNILLETKKLVDLTYKRYN